MIRPVKLSDAKAITDIYNKYVTGSTITFETEPISITEMQHRIERITANFPYYVYEIDDKIAGYCYAHQWKEREAYRFTLETTIYLAPEYQHKGIGTKLMTHLIGECRRRGYAVLIACITGGNEPSSALHHTLGFTQVSCFKNVGYKFGKWLDVIDFELQLNEHKL